MSDAQKREINVGDQKKDTQATANTGEKKEKTKGQIRKENKKAAILRLINFVKANTKEKQLLEDCVLLTPGNRTFTRSTSIDVIVAAFDQKKEWHENEIWEKFKLGRGEMRKISRKLIKDAKTPEERVWLDFNPITGKYTFVHKGKDMPSGWRGYRPVNAADLLS